MADKEGERLTPKELLVLLPALGSILAIVYDLGFFVGLQADYFTLFSLSEHLVFAIQALPIGLGSSLVAITILMFLQTTLAGDGRLTFQTKGMRKIAFLILGIVFILTGIVAAILKQYFLVIQTFICILIVLYLLTTQRLRWPVAILFVTVIAVSAIFFVGAQLGHDIKLKTAPNSVITMSEGAGEYRGVFIRNGERGILLFDTDARHLVL